MNWFDFQNVQLFLSLTHKQYGNVNFKKIRPTFQSNKQTNGRTDWLRNFPRNIYLLTDLIYESLIWKKNFQEKKIIDYRPPSPSHFLMMIDVSTIQNKSNMCQSHTHTIRSLASSGHLNICCCCCWNFGTRKNYFFTPTHQCGSQMKIFHGAIFFWTEQKEKKKISSPLFPCVLHNNNGHYYNDNHTSFMDCPIPKW